MYTHTVQRLHLLIEQKKKRGAHTESEKQKGGIHSACNLVCTELSRKVDDSHVLFAPLIIISTFRSVHCDGDERHPRRAYPPWMHFYPPQQKWSAHDGINFSVANLLQRTGAGLNRAWKIHFSFQSTKPHAISGLIVHWVLFKSFDASRNKIIINSSQATLDRHSSCVWINVYICICIYGFGCIRFGAAHSFKPQLNRLPTFYAALLNHTRTPRRSSAFGRANLMRFVDAPDCAQPVHRSSTHFLRVNNVPKTFIQFIEIWRVRSKLLQCLSISRTRLEHHCRPNASSVHFGIGIGALNK